MWISLQIKAWKATNWNLLENTLKYNIGDLAKNENLGEEKKRLTQLEMGCQQLMELAASIGLQGEEAVVFIREQQQIARDERAEEREFDAAERQREFEAAERHREFEAAEKQREFEVAERQREFELEIARIKSENRQCRSQRKNNDHRKSPKLPTFVDGKDDIGSYLLRFERFAKGNNWDEEHWATSLSALLSGKALDVYSRLSDDAPTFSDPLMYCKFVLKGWSIIAYLISLPLQCFEDSKYWPSCDMWHLQFDWK